MNAYIAMAQQHGAEGVPLVDTTASYPNTPLSSSKTEQRCPLYRPPPSGKALSPPSTPCVSSASFLSGEVQQSHILYAASAGTTQRQRLPACLPALSSPDEYEFFSGGQPLLENSATSTLRGRCRSFIELLLATACLSCQAASREVLEQHVRKRKFKRSCEALTNFLQLRVGAEVAPAFPGSQQLPVLAAAASLCTLKQQCRLLRSANNEDSSGSPAVSDGVCNDSSTSLPYSGAGAYSHQALRASGTAASSACCPYPADAPLSFAGRTEAAASSDDVVFVVAADMSKGGSGRLPGRVLAASTRAEKAGHRSLAPATAATTQRTFPVQHVRVCCSGDDAAEIALQLDMPTQQSEKGLEGSTAVSRAAPRALASAAERPHALADFRNEEGCGEAAAVDGDRENAREKVRGGVCVEEGPAAPQGGQRSSGKVGEHTDTAGVRGGGGAEKHRRSSTLRETGSLFEGSAVASRSVIAERPPPPAVEAGLNSEARARAAAVSTDGRWASTQEGSAAGKEQGLSSEGGDEVGKEPADEECTGTSAATAAPPVAWLTLQQLKDVVGAAQLYCDTLEKQLQCFTENMPQLQRLSQLEAFLKVKEKGLNTETCTPRGERDVRSRDDKDTISGNANRGRSGTSWRSAEDTNSSSGKGCGAGSGVSGAERPDDVGLSITTTDRDDPAVVDSRGTTRAALSSLLQEQQTNFMSVLQQLRLPRDKDLTAAQVLGVRAAVDSTTAAAEHAPQAAAGRSDPTAAMTGPAGTTATTVVKHRKAGELSDSRDGEQQQRSSSSAEEDEPEAALRVPAPAADGKSSAKAAEAQGDVTQKQHQQHRRIVSLADVPDLSVLERSRESAEAACRWQQHALRKKAVWCHKVGEAMNSAGVVTGVAAVERTVKEVRRDSTESSVILVEHSERSGDGETRTGDKTEPEESPTKKRRRGTANAMEGGTQHGESAAAESSDEEEEIVAGAREAEALCEAVGRESVKLLELVTFYENFSAECLRYAAQDRDFSDGENSRDGEHT